MRVERGDDVGAAWLSVVLEQRRGRDQDAGQAIAALAGLLVEQRLLQRMHAAIAGKPLHLPGGGNYAVDQVHIADVVQGVLLALDKGRHRFDAYHITTGRAVSFNEVVSIIKER